MTIFRNSLLAGLLAICSITSVFGQATLTAPTLSAAITASQTQFALSSTTGVTAGTSFLYIGGASKGEYMQVTSIPVSGTVIVRRGLQGTPQVAWTSGRIAYVGTAAQFGGVDHYGSCLTTDPIAVPEININTGRLWTCTLVAAGVYRWTSSADSAYFLSATEAGCVGANTGTAGAATGTVILDGSVPALKSSATNAAASVHTFSCLIAVPTRVTNGKGSIITDLTVVYSVQTTTATSMSTPTLTYFQAPAAALSETASSATTVASAGGTLTMTPAVASANLTAVSAGQYYTEKIVLGTPLHQSTDLRSYVLSFIVSQSASAAQIVTVPGIWVHYFTPIE